MIALGIDAKWFPVKGSPAHLQGSLLADLREFGLSKLIVVAHGPVGYSKGNLNRTGMMKARRLLGMKRILVVYVDREEPLALMRWNELVKLLAP